ncbi:hypothetical protein [Sphingosinithalassobacter portus]|uniref:hypothetical protein n=1 Tax=Stakelama portus TaxID=2676234 RepID=UPI0011AB4E9E|nr:hypothetical protein [Sphingosinithalassobacter portus]
MIFALMSATLLSAAATGSTPPEPEWKVVTASINDRQLMLQWVDRESIARPDTNTRIAWTYFITMNDAIHARAQFDCVGRRWELDRISIELPDGTVTQVPGSSGWQEVPYDRPIGRVLDFVCSGGTTATDLEMSIANGTPVAASREVLRQYAARADAARQNTERQTQHQNSGQNSSRPVQQRRATGNSAN